jgi:hypothetical protein
MKRFTTEPLTDADLREMLRKAMHELGEKAHLKSQDLWKLNIRLQQSVFQGIHLSDIVLGAVG